MTYRETGLDLVSDGRAERLRALEVSSDYFRTLGSDLQRGREFDREDEVGTARLVLSDALWRTPFDADPGVTAAGGISYLPATGNYNPWGNRIITGPLAGT